MRLPGKVVGRAGFGTLLASSSIAALMLGGGVPPAYAACNTTYNNTTSAGCTNSTAITGIAINNSTITSTITNTGTISPNGIALTNGSTITGAIVDPGTINGGLSLDGTSKISATGNAVEIVGPTFTGGISNGGTISAGGGSGLQIATFSTFAGGITNSGTIHSGSDGIDIFNNTSVATFSGGITTSGTISAGADAFEILVSSFSGGISINGTVSAPNSFGIVLVVSNFSGGISLGSSSHMSTSQTAIYIAGTTNFTGGISNAGTISSTRSGSDGINVTGGVISFADGVVNSGAISAKATGVAILSSTFNGGVTNSGTISGGLNGILLAGVRAFSGGISNGGLISAHTDTGISLNGIASFGGGIANSGTITAGVDAINLVAVTTFSGGITNSGALLFTQYGIALTASSTFSGGISNGGTISGGQIGIYLLDNTNFSGGLANSGKIVATTGVNLEGDTSFLGGISNTGTISANLTGIKIAAVSQFSGGITNAGTITATNDFGLLVHNVSTFSGSILNAGPISAPVGIQISRTGQFGSSAGGGISNSGTISATKAIFVFEVSTFSGGVANSGTISATKTGITLSGVSTFLGSISNSGTISAAHGIVISNTTGVSVFDSGTIIGTSGFAINFSTGPNTLTLGPGFDIQGKVIGSGTDIFQLGGTGSGNFNLATIGPTQYEGFTTFNVIGGVWNTTGTFGQLQAWNVNGGTLAGTGTFQSVDVNAGGTLAPGTPDAPGTLMTINGGLTFASGAVYLATLNSTTASRANVANTASLAGTVSASLTGSLSHQTYDILHAGTVSGTFSGFSANNLSGTLTYTPTDVFLNLAANLGGGTALNVNQSNVANTINTYFNNGGTLPPGFGSVFGLTGASLGHALTQLDGEAATGAGKGAFQLMTDFLDLMLDPTAGGGGNASGGATGFAPEQDTALPPEIAQAYAGVLKAQPAKQTFDQRWTAWGSAFGGTSWTKGDAAIDSNNVNASDYGFAAGMEYRATPNMTYGFGLAGGGTNWNLAQSLGSGRSDSFTAGVYAKSHAGPAYLSAAVAFANHWFNTDRIALSDQLRASFTGQSYAARLEGGYRYAVPITGAIIGVTPYAALQAQDFHTPSYSETDLTGGGFALSYNSMNATDTRSELGARFDNLQVVDGMPLVLRGRLAWAHDWYTNATALNAAFQTLPGSNFTVNGAAPPKNSALTTAAAELHITSNWTAIAKFDGDFGSGSQTYGGTGTLRYSW